ncbi:hypothetical protein K525DRAFT_282642 [Schizophyllum commune Loenen D]|nr:hypothetical protein K525DRAFT_282642 [Schizophyllum commune Loenen D]
MSSTFTYSQSPAIVQSLASIPGISTLVLTRKSTLRPAWLPAEAAHAGVDYNEVPGTAADLREHKVEVVIFPGMGILQQIPLADAAKTAGVQLFVPSEFGTVSKGFPKEEAPEFVKEKLTVAEHLEAIGLPYARVYVTVMNFWPGIFHDFALHLVGYTVNKKVNILKGLTGNTPFSFMHTNDIGGFVAYIVTHYPLSELAWKSFRIEGEHVLFNELAALLNAPAEKVEAIPTDRFWPVTFNERGLLNTETKIVDGDGAGGANHLWKGHKWTGVKEGLNLQ